MKVYIDSYNTCRQNSAGGVQSKILDTCEQLKTAGLEVSLFNKWEDKVEDCDILHFFKLSNEYESLLKLAKKKGVKIVISAIVALEGGNRIALGLKIGKYLHLPVSLSKEILDLSDAIITETILEKEFICKYYKIPTQKITVIPNGISPSILNGDPTLFRAKYDIEGKFVLQLGRFDKNKNQLNVIRALKETDVKVVFIGGPDAGQKDYFEKCKQESNSNMILAGWINHSDPMLASALLAADVLVLPSYKEIFGNAIFEGIANSTKVVATNVLPIKQWGLGEMVLPVDPSDLSDIKDKILRSLDLECNRGIVSKVIKEYSFSSIAEQHISLYNKVLGL